MIQFLRTSITFILVTNVMHEYTNTETSYHFLGLATLSAQSTSHESSNANPFTKRTTFANLRQSYPNIPMTAAPCTAPITKRIKVHSDLNQQPQWLLIPKAAKSVRDLVQSLVVRLELPDTPYDLCLDDAPILPNEDVALVRDGEHLHLRHRQLPSPQPPRLDQLHEHQHLSISSGPDDIRRETHRKRKRVLTPEGKRRRNVRNRKREKRRRLERRESPNKRDPTISNSKDGDLNTAGDTVAPDACNDQALPDPSLRNVPRESPDKSDPSISNSQHGGRNAAGDTADRCTGHDPTSPDLSPRSEPQIVSADTAAPSHIATPCLPHECENVGVHQPPDGQNEDVGAPSAEVTSPLTLATSEQLSNLKSNEQMTTSESHGEAGILMKTANKNATLRDKGVLEQNDKRNVDPISSAEAVQSEVNNSECGRDNEVTVSISFVNELMNEDEITANPTANIDDECEQQGHSLLDVGQKQTQPADEVDPASISQENKQVTLQNVRPRWKRQRLQENNSIREQPDLLSTSVAGAENKDPLGTSTSVTNDASSGLETQEHPGRKTDAQMSKVETAVTTKSPESVINLVDVEADVARASDGLQGPRQCVSTNSSKSNSPQSIVVSPAEPRKPILTKGGFSILHALQVARKAGLLAGDNQKDEIQNKPKATPREGGKVRKKSKRRKRSKSSMRYLTEEQVNESTFVGHRPETMLPPLELLELPEGADELRQTVDVPEALLKTAKRSSPEPISLEQKDSKDTSEPLDKTGRGPLNAPAASSTILLSDNLSESAKQEKVQPTEEPRFRSGLISSQPETQASEQQRHGVRREVVAQNPLETERTTVDSVSPPFRSSDSFREDLVLMLRHTSETLAEVWGKWDGYQHLEAR